MPFGSAEGLKAAANGDRAAAERIAGYERNTLSIELAGTRWVGVGEDRVVVDVVVRDAKVGGKFAVDERARPAARR